MNFNSFKFDIVVIMGQSNAEGYGCGSIESKIGHIDNCYQLVDINNARIYDNAEGKYCFDYVIPTQMKIEEYHERVTTEGLQYAELASSFARAYVNSSLLEEGRSLLIVKAAVGGSGFHRNEWGIGNPLDTRAIELIKYALSLNKENKVKCVIWHQGENNSACYEYEKRTYEFAKEHYYNCFTSQIKHIFEECNFKVPVITGGFVNDWWQFEYPAVKVYEDAVMDALKQGVKDLDSGYFVDTNDLGSNRQDNGEGDDIHFSRKSTYILGERMFNAYKEILK